jgi:hypothetical protein
MKENFMISTADCEFRKETGDLLLTSDHLPDGRFPRSLTIKSYHTGNEVLFEQITSDHPRYDEDGWDGEMALYVPRHPNTNVKLLTIYHGC